MLHHSAGTALVSTYVAREPAKPFQRPACHLLLQHRVFSEGRWHTTPESSGMLGHLLTLLVTAGPPAVSMPALPVLALTSAEENLCVQKNVDLRLLRSW